ncbi:hypothetical protein CDLVIII_4350 [Clostridium sp. DL-VIII]|nr:XkdX family protein [Clostridium sp. DL-VIII]EHJ00864.1 hypothetical protein CDLVIII_4350 [Clostridium sp. DL-VIII]
MYERLLYLYQQGKLDETQLSAAVSKTWITEDEKAEIIAGISTATAASS